MLNVGMLSVIVQIVIMLRVTALGYNSGQTSNNIFGPLCLKLFLHEETVVDTFVQLGFSSKNPLWVTSGRMYCDSLVAKPLSDLYYNNCSNCQQSNNWQKVQFNSDLLNQRHGNLYIAKWHWLKQNEMKNDY